MKASSSFPPFRAFLNVGLFTLALVAVMAVGAVALSNRQTAPAAEPVLSDPVLSVNAMDLALAYLQNAARADSAYAGKELYVTGNFGAVVNSGDGYTVSLGSGDALVLCQFDSSRRDSLASLINSDLVTIEGRCAGASGTSVVITDCKLAGSKNSQ